MASTLPQLNIVDFEPQIIWLLVIFSLFYILVHKKIVPYFRDETENRAKKIAENYQEAKKLQVKAERLADEYNKNIQAIHLRANDLVMEAKEKIKRYVEQEKNRINNAINIKMNAYSQEIDKNMKDVDAELFQSVDMFCNNARNKISVHKNSNYVN